MKGLSCCWQRWQIWNRNSLLNPSEPILLKKNLAICLCHVTCLCCFQLLNLVRCCQSSSVTQSCLTLCDRMDCSTPGLPVLHHLPELAQTHVHWVGDAIQPSYPRSSRSPPTFNLSQHQGLFQWVSSSHQVARVLGLQLQHQSFQWIVRTDFL